ncbi:MAG TPA: HAD-IIIC family phosphatase [Puia sp.]|jgi:FkbH-like protein|nr:HAD-IIIC family phosphatase [Puia sp.]
MCEVSAVRVVLLGDTSTQLLARLLSSAGAGCGLLLSVTEAGFDQIEREVLDPDSELYRRDPQVIILFHSTQRLLEIYDRLSPGEQDQLADDRLRLVDELKSAVHARCKASLIYYNYPETDDAVFGNHSNKTERSFLFQLRKLNYGLMTYAAGQPGFYIVDLATIQNRIGRPALYRPMLYIHAAMAVSEALPAVVAATAACIGALLGRSKKCLVLDLDNTLWGGVIGDDGMEHIEIGSLGIGKAFSALQYWIKKLARRGIILAVCSKNTESIALQPFREHPDMVLGLDDIAIFRVNWNSKVDNLRDIQAVLNIGFDSMVFLDDSPFEREMVRAAIPDITVPELPEDPADWLEFLYGLNLFDTSSRSDEDAERTKLYQTEALRAVERRDYAGEEAFLSGLEMVSRWEPFNTFNSPRVAQLCQRSNQFNLRTVRYTEMDILRMAGEPDRFTFAFSLDDRLGAYGIVCLVILETVSDETLFIDTWLMSCRVLQRGMEQFTLNSIVDFARKRGFRFLKGEYLPTPKNQLVRGHYEKLGFQPGDAYWLLDTGTFQTLKTEIRSAS